MSRVIIAGKGPVVKEEACGRLATGLCAILNNDVKRSDDAGFEDDDGVVWIPGCDKCRAAYSKRSKDACACQNCMETFTQILNGVQYCPLCAAKRSKRGAAPQKPRELQKDLPVTRGSDAAGMDPLLLRTREEVREDIRTNVAINAGDGTEERTAGKDPGSFEVRVRLPRTGITSSSMGSRQNDRR